MPTIIQRSSPSHTQQHLHLHFLWKGAFLEIWLETYTPISGRNKNSEFCCQFWETVVMARQPQRLSPPWIPARTGILMKGTAPSESLFDEYIYVRTTGDWLRDFARKLAKKIYHENFAKSRLLNNTLRQLWENFQKSEHWIRFGNWFHLKFSSVLLLIFFAKASKKRQIDLTGVAGTESSCNFGQKSFEPTQHVPVGRQDKFIHFVFRLGARTIIILMDSKGQRCQTFSIFSGEIAEKREESLTRNYLKTPEVWAFAD